MQKARLIQGYRDKQGRPTRRTIADGLARLEEELGGIPDMRCARLHVPRWRGRLGQFAVIWYSRADGEDIVIDYPFSKGCRAQTTLGARVYLSLGELDAADLDADGNVDLSDGRSVHTLEFDIIPYPQEFTDLEHAIIVLTVRFLKAEETCFRFWPEPEFHWIDYSSVPQLSVRNVKELALYINANIGGLSRAPGDSAFEPVSLSKIQSTLSLAGIRKVRGRKLKNAA